MDQVVSTLPPISLERVDAVTDFYFWEREGLAPEAAAAQALCYAGTAHAQPLAGTSLEPWLRDLIAYVTEHHPQEEDFRVEYRLGDALYLFRGHRDYTVTGTQVALRRHPTTTPHLSELNLPAMWKDLFLRDSLLKGGLILICAVTGKGKSTTLASIVRARLETYGGFCRTVEDPVELPLHGEHGTGVCRQTPVDPRHGEEGFAKALRSSLRSYPALPAGGSMLVVGEVRDSETAAELLRAAVNGHLVLTSMHAGDIRAGVARLSAMAEKTMGVDVARDLLGTALVYAVHQDLTIDPRETGWKRGKITGSMLYSAAASSAVAATIRDGRFANLAQPLDQQQALMRTVATAEQFIARADTMVKRA